ncbi:MAG: DUF1501 domain-containing protein [Isosphaeraceae bacterium]
MLTRREILRRSSVLSLAPMLPAFLTRTAIAAKPERDARILVVVQLDGGNDGINTVVPYRDEAYPRLRRELRIANGRVCKLNDEVGLHPSMRAAADMVQDGRLTIIQGVGYPNPDRSHFRSMAIWQTASPDDPGPTSNGWLGRALDAIPNRREPSAVFIGRRELPRALRARRAITASFADPSDLSLALPADAETQQPDPHASDLSAFVQQTVAGGYATARELAEATGRRAKSKSAVRYPNGELGQQMGLVAQSILSGACARVYYVIQPGYDTHQAQGPVHSQLLGELARSLRAFHDDLAAAGRAEEVLTMAFSEFGRRPEENGSFGTDHGTAGPVILAGKSVRPGPAGTTPKLADLVDGDLRWNIDFRRVYATILDGWLGIPSESVLGQRFEPVPILNV